MECLLTSVGRGLLSIGLDLHTSGDTGVSFTTGQISHVDESVVESSLDVADTEDVVGLFASSGGGGSVVDNLFFLDDGGLDSFSSFRLNK